MLLTHISIVILTGLRGGYRGGRGGRGGRGIRQGVCCVPFYVLLKLLVFVKILM